MRSNFLVTAAVLLACPATAEETRAFPTGGPGTVVSYLDAAGPGHPTACVVGVTAGLPIMAFSTNVFNNGQVTMTVASEQPFLHPAVGADAGVSVGPVFLFGKVERDTIGGSFHLLTLKIIDGRSGDALSGIYKALNQMIYNAVRVSIVADDAPLLTVNVPPQPGLGPAFEACQKYQQSRPR